jgi:hypothetical protein
MSRAQIVLVLALSVTVAFLVAAQAIGASDATPRVEVGAWPPRTVIRPQRFIAGSGVAGGVMRLRDMRWFTWGANRAAGRGLLTFNTCRPGGCATGHLKTIHATVTLTAPRRNCKAPVAGGGFTTWRFPVFTRIAAVEAGTTDPWRSITSAAQYCRR